MSKSLRRDKAGFSHIEIIFVTFIILAAGFTAWRVVGAQDDNNSSQASVSESDRLETLSDLTADLSTLKPLSEIQAAVKDDAPGLRILSITLEVEDGVTIYKLNLSDGNVLAYDAFTGASVQHSNDNDSDSENDEALPASFAAGISIQDAIAIASEKRPNSTLEEVEIEVEDGVVVYSVRFTDDSRVDVNAADGTIERIKNEQATDEDSSEADSDADDQGEDSDEQGEDDNDQGEDDDHQGEDDDGQGEDDDDQGEDDDSQGEDDDHQGDDDDEQGEDDDDQGGNSQ